MAFINPNDGCGCPPDYNLVNGECVKVETTPATYTGTTVPVLNGDTNTAYNKFGLRVYPNLSTIDLPISSTTDVSIPSIVLDDANGNPITPVLSGIRSQLWGLDNTSINTCGSNSNLGRLNNVGIRAALALSKTEVVSEWNTLNPTNLWQDLTDLQTQVDILDPCTVTLEFCVEPTTTKEYCIGLAGDNEAVLSIDGNIIAYIGNRAGIGASVGAFVFWHVFPITLTAGQHIIKLQGINVGTTTNAAFGAEIYDITSADLQANLTDIAVQNGPCGNTAADLDPYIIFSTGNYLGEDIPDLSAPGEWVCPGGVTVDSCNGVPVCEVTFKADQLPCCYKIEACLNPGVYIQIQLDSSITQTLEVDNIYAFGGDVAIEGQCFKVIEELPCDTPDYTNVTIVTDYRTKDCSVCVPCYELTDCKTGDTLVIKWNPDDTPLQTSGTIYVFDFAPTKCWTAELLIPPCTGTQYGTSNIVTTHSTCEECLKPCFKIVDCIDGSIVYSDTASLIAYVGEIISWNDGVDDKCGTVSKYICIEDPQSVIQIVVIDCFKTCVDCLPAPPVPPPAFEPQYRTVKPGYNTPACTTDYVDKVSCKWSEALYQFMATERFGLEFCCETDLRKWSIKKEILDIALITDPEACKSIPAPPPLICKEYTVSNSTFKSTTQYLACGDTEITTVLNLQQGDTICADASIAPYSYELTFVEGNDCGASSGCPGGTCPE